MGSIELGSGLLALGRSWGTTPRVPSDDEAQWFLEGAQRLGINYFDTAPAYGASELRLGKYVTKLNSLSGFTIATKFGEHWDDTTQTAYADHSAEALVRSIDQSIRNLGSISLLQLHKPSPEILQSSDLRTAIEYARHRGIDTFGISVKDEATAEAAVESDLGFSSMQLEFNKQAKPEKTRIIDLATAAGWSVVINRPLGEGKLLSQVEDKFNTLVDAYKFILNADFNGVILTGTSNPMHLAQNAIAFEHAKYHSI